MSNTHTQQIGYNFSRFQPKDSSAVKCMNFSVSTEEGGSAELLLPGFDLLVSRSLHSSNQMQRLTFTILYKCPNITESHRVSWPVNGAVAQLHSMPGSTQLSQVKGKMLGSYGGSWGRESCKKAPPGNPGLGKESARLRLWWGHLLCRQQEKASETEVLGASGKQDLIYLFWWLLNCVCVWTIDTSLECWLWWKHHGCTGWWAGLPAYMVGKLRQRQGLTPGLGRSCYTQQELYLRMVLFFI